MGNEMLVREMNEAKLEALIETMYLAAQADDEFTAEERAHFVSSVQSLTERRLEGDERTRKLGLSMAIRMLAADGILRTSEREFIVEMAQALGIDSGAAADLVKEIAG